MLTLAVWLVATVTLDPGASTAMASVGLQMGTLQSELLPHTPHPPTHSIAHGGGGDGDGGGGDGDGGGGDGEGGGGDGEGGGGDGDGGEGEGGGGDGDGGAGDGGGGDGGG